MSRPDWTTYHLGICRAVAARADCTRAQHGATVVRPDNTIASTGYNGSVPGGPSCLEGACPRGRHYPLMTGPEYHGCACGDEFCTGVTSLSSYDFGDPKFRCESQHAENNALARTREDTAGYTLYVTGQPCAGCIRTARAHRIARIVWADGASYQEMSLV